jgi:hypothetical protein
MIVIDNFIKDETILEEISNDFNFFSKSVTSDKEVKIKLNYNHDAKHGYKHPYMFWDGWWRSPVNTLKKKVIKKIWENNLEWPLDDILGFEYWSKTYMPGQYLETHVDEDTFLYSDKKIFQGPITGSIYYGTDNKDGGFLEVHKNLLIDGDEKSLEKDNIKKFISPEEDRERIAYKGNRLIIFDAGHQLHGTTPSKSGIREVLIVNVWHKDTPPVALFDNRFLYE